MVFSHSSPLQSVAKVMHQNGAIRVIFKLLANNDNSKQQVYLGGDDIVHLLPHGDLVGKLSLKDGAIYKAPLNLWWVDLDEPFEPSSAPGTQLIYYPRYPEVRLSGFLRGSKRAPSSLMRAPTRGERAFRDEHKLARCLVLGICADGRVLAFLDEWGGKVALEAAEKICSGNAFSATGLFYELEQTTVSGRTLLLNKLLEIYKSGPVPSSRLDKGGKVIEYRAKNGAGYTLESLFDIIPNGNAEPDYHGWELKSHSSGALTLMTPEPDLGTYKEDLATFLDKYGRSSEKRKDFTGRHIVDKRNETTGLTLQMHGYDPKSCEIVDPRGGLYLLSPSGEIAAGWSFDKIMTHWARKHAQTAYVSYKKIEGSGICYQYGPEVHLCEGAKFKAFLSSLHSNLVYHDPGIKMEFANGRWKAKKRNQFRTTWKAIHTLYNSVQIVDLSV